MNKLFLLLVLVFGIHFSSTAQVESHALGLRFGGSTAHGGAEISYQHGFSDANRLEIDLGFRGAKHYGDFFVAGSYQWLFNIEGGFNWFVGPGAAVGFYSYDDGTNNGKSSGVRLAAGGQIGIEYNFRTKNVPLALTLDARPMFNVIGYGGYGFGWGAALGVRYLW